MRLKEARTAAPLRLSSRSPSACGGLHLDTCLELDRQEAPGDPLPRLRLDARCRRHPSVPALPLHPAALCRCNEAGGSKTLTQGATRCAAPHIALDHHASRDLDPAPQAGGEASRRRLQHHSCVKRQLQAAARHHRAPGRTERGGGTSPAVERGSDLRSTPAGL